MPHPWRHSRPGWMWLWAAWAAGCDPAHSRGLELDEHCGPFQPRPSYDAMMISLAEVGGKHSQQSFSCGKQQTKVTALFSLSDQC